MTYTKQLYRRLNARNEADNIHLGDAACSDVLLWRERRRW